MDQLSQIAPKFLVHTRNIRILKSPVEFYAYLCERVMHAKRRVFLASLYLGNKEFDFVDVLSKSLKENQNLELFVLLDGLRGTREHPEVCSATLLAPLIAKYKERVKVSFYRTPSVAKWPWRSLPNRINEGLGLQHMKMYGFDDEILLSGANLNKDYFTNRQDRYISFRDSSLSNYFFNVHSEVCKLSHPVVPVVNSVPAEDLDSSGSHVMQYALLKPQTTSTTSLSKLLEPALTTDENTGESTDENKSENKDDEEVSEDCVEVYPVFQFTPLKLGNELAALQVLANEAVKSTTEWVLTSGYFNLFDKLAKMFQKANNGTVIIAAQEANGFYESKGFSKHIPHVYSLAARRFMSKCKYSLRMREWSRGVVNLPNGWSYHAKGMWILNNMKTPLATYIGSSNFTCRSYLHDLECGAVATKKGGLPRVFTQELDNLYVHCSKPLSKSEVSKPTPTDWMLLKLFRNRL